MTYLCWSRQIVCLCGKVQVPAMKKWSLRKYVVSVLGGQSTDVAEGKEPGECLHVFLWCIIRTAFLHSSLLSWILVGSGWKEGKGVPNIFNSAKYGQPPRLFGCSNKTGRLMVSESHRNTQAGWRTAAVVNMVMSWIICLVLILRLMKFLETSLSQTWLPMMSCCLTPGIRWVDAQYVVHMNIVQTSGFQPGGLRKLLMGLVMTNLFPDLTCSLAFYLFIIYK